LTHYPFRYEDRTRFYFIREVDENLPYVQVKGKLGNFAMAGNGPKKRLTAPFQDSTGTLELVWFQGIKWTLQKIKPGIDYVLFGKPARYGNRITIAHPELEPVGSAEKQGNFLQPVYSITERLRTSHADSKLISKLVREVLLLTHQQIPENLPESIRSENKLIGKALAVRQIHFPVSPDELSAAQRR
jgi:ATP-dependent DNA helicase RecG